MSDPTFDVDAFDAQGLAEYQHNLPIAQELNAADFPDDVADAAEETFGLDAEPDLIVDPTASTVVGNPVADGDYWLFQGEAGTCAPTSIAMVLSQVAGVPLESNQQVVDRAVELGLLDYDPATWGAEDGWSGMTAQGMELLLEDYGVDAEVRNGDLDTLETDIAAGRPVIVTVDSDEIMYNESDLLSGDSGVDFNHVLVVTAIDRTNGWVSMNNSNDPGGPGLVVPLSQFEDAWADSGNEMIVATLPADESELNAQGATLDFLEPGEKPGAPALTPSGTASDVLEVVPTGLEAADAERTFIWLPFELVARALEQIR